MNIPDFDTFTLGFMKEMGEILVSKGADYSEHSDRLSNFKIIAGFLGCTPELVWAVYGMKHLLAITAYVKKGVVASEPIRGRFLDLANYCVLGSALVAEKEARAEVRQ